MSENTIKEEIVNLYNDCVDLFLKIQSNKTKIGYMLEKYVVSTPIGEGVYSPFLNERGVDIALPGNPSDYDEVISTINADLTDIDSLITKNERIDGLLKSATMDKELLEIEDQSSKMLNQMKEARVEREEVLSNLKKTAFLLAEQQMEMIKSGETKPSDLVEDSLRKIKDNNSKEKPQEEKQEKSESSSVGSTPTFNMGDYQAFTSFNNLENDNMDVAKENLATHAENIKNILSYVCLNGEIIGADVYNVTEGDTSSDIGFNFGALQLACDAVNADVRAIGAYITQMENKIKENTAAIESLEETRDETVSVPVYDDDGNYVGDEEVLTHSAAEIAEFNLQIQALEAENTQLEADITAYTEEKQQKTEVFEQLMNIRNAYNEASGGLLNAYAASDLLASLKDAEGTGDLLGIPLTDSQKQELFHNIGNNLYDNKGKYRLTDKEDFNPALGEFPTAAFDFIVNSCFILGDKNSPFSSNYDKFVDYRGKFATSLMGGVTATGDMTDDDDDYPSSEKVVAPEVKKFMEDNRGKMSEIPDDVQHALGLHLEGLVSVPSRYTSDVDYPMLLWLAGTGFAGGTPQNMKNESFVKKVVNGSYVLDGVIIYVPCKFGSGSSEGNNSRYSREELDHDLDHFIAGMNVDKNHISATGTSVGAYALAYLTVSHPNLFSAVALTGGGFDGGQNRDIHIEDAIQASPNTTFIWYIADNDQTTLDKNGDGVRTYTERQHEELIKAGMNSVYYEVGGNIWHTETCDRFANDAMLQDLVRINKGEHYVVPTSIQHVSSKQAYDSAISHNGTTNDWYHQLTV